MKAFRNEKVVVEGPISRHVTGIVCDRMELDARDTAYLAKLSMGPVEQYQVFMAQFAGRFTDNRSADKPSAELPQPR